MKTLNCILFYFLIIKIIGELGFCNSYFPNPSEILFMLMHCCFKQKGEDARKGLTISGTGGFSFHPNGASFVKSSEICGEIGGEMVVLDSPEKEAMLTDYIEGWSSNKAF